MKIARVQINERELTARIEGDKLIALEGTPIAPGPETGEVLDIATVKFLVPSSPSKIGPYLRLFFSSNSFSDFS